MKTVTFLASFSAALKSEIDENSSTMYLVIKIAPISLFFSLYCNDKNKMKEILDPTLAARISDPQIFRSSDPQIIWTVIYILISKTSLAQVQCAKNSWGIPKRILLKYLLFYVNRFDIFA